MGTLSEVNNPLDMSKDFSVNLQLPNVDVYPITCNGINGGFEGGNIPDIVGGNEPVTARLDVSDGVS